MFTWSPTVKVVAAPTLPVETVTVARLADAADVRHVGRPLLAAPIAPLSG